MPSRPIYGSSPARTAMEAMQLQQEWAPRLAERACNPPVLCTNGVSGLGATFCERDYTAKISLGERYPLTFYAALKKEINEWLDMGEI